MTVRQFFNYLISYPQTRELAFVLAEVVDEQRLAAYRRSA